MIKLLKRLWGNKDRIEDNLMQTNSSASICRGCGCAGSVNKSSVEVRLQFDLEGREREREERENRNTPII